MSKVIKGLAFDELHELPDSIRTGEVNLIVCDKCNHSGHIWDGMIIFDKKHKRILYIDLLLEPIDQLQQRATTAWELCQKELDGSSGFILWDRVVILQDYSDILQTLTLPNHIFKWHVTDCIDYIERANIGDLERRAAMCFEQLTARAAMVFKLRGRELTNEFRRALHLHAQEKIDQNLDERHVDMANKLLSSHLLHVQNSDPPTRSNVHPSQGFGSRNDSALPVPSKELVHSVKKNFEARKYLDIRLRDDCVSASEAVLESFAHFTTPTTGNDEKSDNLELVASALVDILSQDVLKQNYKTPEGEKITLEAMISLATKNHSGWLIETIFQSVFSVLMTQECADRLLLASIRYFTEITKVFDSLEAAYSAMMIATQYFEHRKETRAVSSHLYLGGVNLFCQIFSEYGQVAVYSGYTQAIGIAWESTGTYFASHGQSTAALQSYQIAKALLQSVGHRDGAMRCAIASLKALDVQRKLQLVDLQGFESEFQSDMKFQSEDVSTLSAARKYNIFNYLIISASWHFRNEIQETAFICGIKKDFDSSEIVDNEKIIVFEDQLLFDSGEREYSQARLLGKPLFSAEEMDRSIVPDQIFMHDFEGNPLTDLNGLNGGFVEYLVANVEGTPPYVTLVKFTMCRWVYRYAMALDFAHACKDEALWLRNWSILIEDIGILPNTGIQNYLSRYVELFSPTRGIEEEKILGILISGAMGRVRQYTDWDLDPASSTYLREVKDRFLEILGSDPISVIERVDNLGVDPVLQVVGETYEALGCVEIAYETQLLRLQHALDLIKRSHVAYFERPNVGTLVRPLYQAARTLARSKVLCPERSSLLFALGELCKSVSSEQVDFSDLDVSDLRLKKRSEDATSVDNLGRLLEKESFPRGTVLIQFTLLHETKMNSGCWLRTVKFPNGEFPTTAQRIDFNQVYSAVQKVGTCFQEAEECITGVVPAEAAGKLVALGGDLRLALSELSALLIPDTLAEQIVNGRLGSIVFLPEGYLIDVPYAALELAVQGQTVPIGLFQLGDEPLQIMISPSLTSLFRGRRRSQNSYSREASGNLVAALVPDVPWSTKLLRLRGVRPRVEKAIGSWPIPSPRSCRDFLQPDVRSILDGLKSSDTFVFFGHGHVTSHGSTLVASDGVIGAPEIAGLGKRGPISTRVAILLSCFGISSSTGEYGRELSGVHIELLKLGVVGVLGSARPLTAVVATMVLESLSERGSGGISIAKTVGKIRIEIHTDERFAHPVFWAYLTCFGDGFADLNPMLARCTNA